MLWNWRILISHECAMHSTQYMSAWSSYTRYHIGNHHNDCLLDKLHESAFISVVYFNMEKMLLYWSVDQYNIMQQLQKTMDRKEGCQGGRKGLILPTGYISFTFHSYLFQLVSPLYILTSSLCAVSLCIPTSSWLARHTLLYLITIQSCTLNGDWFVIPQCITSVPTKLPQIMENGA